jgi:uncharacterized repeat protein (TIGR01451 family)
LTLPILALVGAVAGTVCTKTIGSVNVSNAGSLNFAVKTNNTVPAGVNNLSITTTIADDGTNGPETSVLNNTSTDLTPLNATPDLTVTIDDNLTVVSPDQTITYTLNIQNIGNQGASGVVINSQIPNNSVFISASNSGTNNLGSVSWLVANLNAGEIITRTVTIKINTTIPAGVNNLTATANVTDNGVNGVDPTPLNNLDNDIDTLEAFPDLVISKTDSGSTATPGTQINYTISYSNEGNQTATGVVITETIPANTTYIATGSSNWSCPDGSIAGTICTINIGTLNSGDSGNLTLKVKILDSLSSGITQTSNSITINDDGTNGTDPTQADNQSTETTPLIAAPDLAITKTNGLTQIGNNDTFTYTLTASNIGNQDSENVIITDILPNYLSVINISDGGTLTGNTITWPTINLTVNQSIIRTIDVVFNSGTSRTRKHHQHF